MTEKKTERVVVRFTPGQLKQLEEDAGREHRTLSGLIRSRALRPSEGTGRDAVSADA